MTTGALVEIGTTTDGLGWRTAVGGGPDEGVVVPGAEGVGTVEADVVAIDVAAPASSAPLVVGTALPNSSTITTL